MGKVVKMHVRKGDTVQVISGVDAGRQGKVLEVQPRLGRVVVDGIRMVKKHAKANQKNRQGGVIDQPAAIPGGKVQLVCPSCSKPTRVGRERSESGEVSRICRRCGKRID